MIFIEECRKLIPDNQKFTDKQIEEIRSNMDELADLALKNYQQSKGDEPKDEV